MKTAAEYLRNLYGEINSQHVVEIGADSQMKLIAHSAQGIPRVSVVDFARDNEYKSGWWEMHREMGLNVVRVDGDARKLSELIESADVVYAQAVQFSQDGNKDVIKSLQQRSGEITLTSEEMERLRAGFIIAEAHAIGEAETVSSNGHLVWMTYRDGSDLFTKLAKHKGRKLESSRILRMTGEDPDNVLNLYHLSPKN